MSGQSMVAGARRSILTAASLWAACLSIPTTAASAQPAPNPAPRDASGDVDGEIAALRTVIENVEQRGWILIPSRGSYYAISREQFADDYGLKVLQGELDPDSVESRVRRFLAGSRDRLDRAKRQLAQLESSRPTPTDANVLLRWKGADTTVSMSCECRYPNCGYPGSIDLEIKNVSVVEQGATRWFNLELWRGRMYVSSLGATVNASGNFVGEKPNVQAPVDDVVDVGTLTGSADWLITLRATATQVGTMVARGLLTFEGKDASCWGRWDSGWPQPL